MAAAEEKLSPEEKLLKVIQGGGDAAGQPAEADKGPSARPRSAAPAPPTAAAPAPVAPEAPRPVARPKLKVARPPEPESEPGVHADAAPTQVTGAAAGGAAPAVAALDVGPYKGSGEGAGIRIVNRCLAAAVLIMLCLAGFEIYANATARMPERPAQVDQIFEPAAGAIVRPPLQKLVEDFENRPILGVPPDREKSGTTDGGPAGPRPVDYQQTFKLIGISSLNAQGAEKEAIVVNRDENKMYFLRIGDKVVFDKKELVLEQIEPDHVVFLMGNKRVEIR